VHLLARNAFGIVGCKHGRSADVAALLSDGLRATVNHIINECGIKTVSLSDGNQGSGCKLYGGDLMQRSVDAAAAPGSAGVVINICDAHSAPQSFARFQPLCSVDVSPRLSDFRKSVYQPFDS